MSKTPRGGQAKGKEPFALLSTTRTKTCAVFFGKLGKEEGSLSEKDVLSFPKFAHQCQWLFLVSFLMRLKKDPPQKQSGKGQDLARHTLTKPWEKWLFFPHLLARKTKSQQSLAERGLRSPFTYWKLKEKKVALQKLKSLSEEVLVKPLEGQVESSFSPPKEKWEELATFQEERHFLLDRIIRYLSR